MTAFLDQGGGLYVEGCDFGAYNSPSELYDRFGCTYINDGWPATTGNVDSLTGMPGTPVYGYDFAYLYQQGPDNFVDEISAGPGTILYLCQDSIGRAVMYNGQMDTYRALHSTFIFGALQNGSSTKQELMAVYLNYLLGN